MKREVMGYPESSGLVASWFSGDHPDNQEQISNLDGQYAFLLFKQAVATGWDCPRAKILVKLREGGTERFNIQTVGRIRRMPERHHYDLALLDNCYLYTLDNEFAEGMTSSPSDAFYVYQYRRKHRAPSIALKKESLKGSDRFAVNPEAVVKVVRDAMLKECNLNQDGVLERKEMEKAKGPGDYSNPIFSEKEKASERANKLLLDMTLREFNAFLVNNKERLIEVFNNISQTEIGEIKETEIDISNWGIPKYQYYRHHKRHTATKILGKNLFENYGDNILIDPNRTMTEIAFENWCESSAKVQHVYKNGDKGDDFFCIVYRRAFRRSHFFPDYQ